VKLPRKERPQDAPEMAKKPAAGSSALKRRAVLAECRDSAEEESPPRRLRRLASPQRSPQTKSQAQFVRSLATSKLALEQAPPLEPLRPSTRKQERALALAEVPLDAFMITQVQNAVAVKGRPRRCRFPPLESWRNERLVYERPRGSKVPGVVGVELNLGPRPSTDPRPPRHLHCKALQAPTYKQEVVVEESVGLSTPELETRSFVLPGVAPGRRPHTVRLPPARGQIFVMDGSVRCAYEGDPVAAEMCLSAGDTALLRDERRAVLVASAELEGGVVRFRWVQVKVPAPGRPIVKPAAELKAERPSPRPSLQPVLPPAAYLEL